MELKRCWVRTNECFSIFNYDNASYKCVSILRSNTYVFSLKHSSIGLLPDVKSGRRSFLLLRIKTDIFVQRILPEVWYICLCKYAYIYSLICLITTGECIHVQGGH